MTADSAADYSARLAASGLAGGAVAMAHVAKQCGFQNAIGLDIGRNEFRHLDHAQW